MSDHLYSDIPYAYDELGNITGIKFLNGPVSDFDYNKYGMYNLRAWKRGLGQIADSQSIICDINIFGDSYSYSLSRWVGLFASKIITKLGDAGAGWIGFGFPGATSTANGNVRPSIYPISFSGTWTSNYVGGAWSPDICDARSSTSGSQISITFPANTSTVKLYATGTTSSAGQVRYSVDGGSTWVATITLNTAGSIVTTLSSIPAGAFTLVFDIVGSNTCRLHGVYATNTTTTGIRVNNCAASGNRASYIAGFANATWATMVTNMTGGGITNPVLNLLMIGVNDQGASRTQAQFQADIITFTSALKTANPSCDIMLIAPMENNRATNTYPMSSYQAILLSVAKNYGYAFQNLQPEFGPDPTVYAATGTHPLMNADLLHPEPTTGGKLMAQTIYASLMSGSLLL